MPEYKWCLIEIEHFLLGTGWQIQRRIEPKLKGYSFRKWIIEKEGHTLTLEFYHVYAQENTPVYTSDLLTYACKIKGTDIGLHFLEYYQKDDWMELLRQFGESLNFHFNLVDFDGHAREELNAEEAIRIAEEFIDQRENMEVKINGLSWAASWWDGNRNVNEQVWVVSGNNLKARMDGTYFYSIVVNIRTKTVEDVSLM